MSSPVITGTSRPFSIQFRMPTLTRHRTIARADSRATTALPDVPRGLVVTAVRADPGERVVRAAVTPVRNTTTLTRTAHPAILGIRQRMLRAEPFNTPTTPTRGRATSFGSRPSPTAMEVNSEPGCRTFAGFVQCGRLNQRRSGSGSVRRRASRVSRIRLVTEASRRG